MSSKNKLQKSLSDEEKELIHHAISARNYAYCPYSGFAVGAAVRVKGKKQKIFTGCNVENASYGATICAERVAICKAISEGERNFDMIAIAGGNTVPAPPCGICLQFMSQFAKNLIILLATADGKKIQRKTLKQLLPLQFVFPHSNLPR